MGAKENLLESIVRKDSSGGVIEIHEKLISLGLKWKGPSNSETLFYFFRSNSKEIGVAAIRQSIFSFPKTFWNPRGALLSRALNTIPSYQKSQVESGISSSQNSSGQIRINRSTTPNILALIDTLIVNESNKAGANIA